jgi:hypothetical protein
VAVFDSGVDFFGGLGAGVSDAEQYPVQPGDYLQVNGGLVVQVKGIKAANRLLLSADPGLTAPTQTWRVIRQPRRLSGEETVKLPDGVAIENGPNPAGNATFPTCSVGIPVRTVAGTSTSFAEVLFSPAGGVLARGTLTATNIVLWVRETGRDSITEGEPVLIVVQTRTGMIAAQPVDTANPGAYPGGYYSNARDPRQSGL